eukprot:g1531.t1
MVKKVGKAALGLAKSQEAPDLSDAEALLAYSEIFRRFTDHYYPDAIRFSIRPTANSTAKLGMNLVGARQAQLGVCTTPWHGVGVQLADGSCVIAKKLHAEKLTGAALFKADPSSKLNHGYKIEGVDAAKSIEELQAMLNANAIDDD